MMSGAYEYLEYKELVQNIYSKSLKEECVTPFWRTNRDFLRINAIIVVCDGE
jgi:hypothetical protein